MKIKFICDKNYGGVYNKNGTVSMIDCLYFDDKVIDRIVKGFSENGTLEMSQKVVDYYNRDSSTAGRKSFKTAANIAKYIKKWY